MVSEGLRAAFDLLINGDPRVTGAVGVSLRVSLTATLIATLLAAPLAFFAAREWSARNAIAVVLNTLTALPTVVVGLLTYAVLSRRGLLGPLGLLYTQSGMIIGETFLITPLMTALLFAVVRSADPRIVETALTLGASRTTTAWAVFHELQPGFVGAIATGFGRVVSELGVAMMVGGNIEGSTRSMTTAITLETGKGEFALGLALGLILLFVALMVNVVGNVLAPSR